MRMRAFSWMVLAIGIVVNTVHAADVAQETPTELPGGFVLSVEETRILIEQGHIYVADCRSAFNFGKGHLPGARSLEYQVDYHIEGTSADNPVKQINLNNLPDNKKNIIIFYSHGPTGWKSYRAAQTAIKAGYTQVHWFRGGIKAWLEAGHKLEY
ncbi:MAG: rhodanese-like domain-containing protein [Chromatiales bacterium]|nr:rhodanese-like domain-containing protein [Chromatiales bacterium]